MFKPKSKDKDSKKGDLPDEKKKKSKPRLFRGFWKSKESIKVSEIESPNHSPSPSPSTTPNQSPRDYELESLYNNHASSHIQKHHTENDIDYQADEDIPSRSLRQESMVQKPMYKSKPQRRTLAYKPQGIKRILEQQSLRNSLKMEKRTPQSLKTKRVFMPIEFSSERY